MSCPKFTLRKRRCTHIGRVLAIERIFALEAVYPQLDSIYPGLGKLLKEHRIDYQLPGFNFYQFDRLSLAETVIVHEGDLFRASTFLEFRKRYEAEDSSEKKWLEPASEAIQSLSLERMEKILDILKMKAKVIADKAGIDSSITRR
jgi:hypothetical protein